MPVYVINPGGRIVRANTSAQAINFAARATMKATPMKPDELVDALARGAKIEDARAPVNQELPLEEAPAAPAVPQEFVETTLRNGNAAVMAEVAPPSITNDPDTGLYRDPEALAPAGYDTAAENLSKLDEVLAEANSDIDTVTLEGTDYVQ